MKFMKLGTRPDTFYTEKATRTLISDVPSDITLQINNITYLLHKFPLLPKCGLLQQLLLESDESKNIAIELHDIPGGDVAFELCAKFCYGITIDLSAHNFIPAYCAAKFLKMTEAVENGNFITKMEAFFSSCILEGWRDSVVALQTIQSVKEWSEDLAIVRKCMESVVDKILTPPPKVSWSYTYTRPGYSKKNQRSVPKDWWTEDISFLDIDMFRCILAAVQSTNKLQPKLIGEALHVYVIRRLPEVVPRTSSTSQAEDSPDISRRILETVVGLIPADKGSVSMKFLLKLLRIANVVEVSPVTKAQLLRLSSLQLEEATLDDLLCSPKNQVVQDIELVQSVLESFLRQWTRRIPEDESQSLSSIFKITKLIDSYLQVVAKNENLPVQKVVSLAVTLPGIARPQHDDLYKAIDIYLKEHPGLSKNDKKQLCGVLDCQKLSPEIRAHAVRNELLPLRKVVQLLLFEHEKGSEVTKTSVVSSQQPQLVSDEWQKLSVDRDEKSKLISRSRSSEPGTSTSRVNENLRNTDDKLQLLQEPSFKIRHEKGNKR